MAYIISVLFLVYKDSKTWWFTLKKNIVIKFFEILKIDGLIYHYELLILVF